MGTRGTHASDGTPRCSEPKQDAEGRWFCPACGRAEGFKSKMAVLGHLRSCRPGKPALGALLGTPAAPPAPASSVYLPTPNEAAQINGMGAILARLDAMQSVQAQHTKALGNHITHLSAATVAPATGGGVSMTDVVKWGGLAVLGLAVVDRFSSRSAGRSLPVGYTPSESTKRMMAKREQFDAARCATQWKAKAEGQEVEIDPACLSIEEPEQPESKPSVLSIKQIAGLVRDVASTGKALKGFFH